MKWWDELCEMRVEKEVQEKGIKSGFDQKERYIYDSIDIEHYTSYMG